MSFTSTTKRHTKFGNELYLKMTRQIMLKEGSDYFTHQLGQVPLEVIRQIRDFDQISIEPKI